MLDAGPSKIGDNTVEHNYSFFLPPLLKLLRAAVAIMTPVENDKPRSKPPMNHSSIPPSSTGMISQAGVVKSALSSQLEQLEDDGSTLKSQLVSLPVNCDVAIEKIRPNDHWFLQTVVQMIAEEKWHDLECFIKSPSKQSSSSSTQTDFEPRSPPKWSKVSSNELKLINSMNGMSLGAKRKCRVDFNHLEIIHFACKHNPPQKVVRHLAKLYNTGATLPDNMGRLPLHYAAQWGASGRLIHYLVQKDSSAACTKDNLGKTPLHLLCENFNANNDPNQSLGLSCDEGMLWIVKLLLDTSPDSINVSTVV